MKTFQALFCIAFLLCGVINIGRGASIRKIIFTEEAPGVGTLPLSQAVQVDDLIYVSGTLGEYLNGEIGEGIVTQTRLAFDNIAAILRAANSSLASVVKVTVLLSDMANYSAMNEVYAEYFDDKFPARMAYQVSRLPADALVEIEVVAISGDVIDV